VFPGWTGFSQWIKHEFGDYPPGELLVELGTMSKVAREENTWFGLFCGRRSILLEKAS
jgi:hypothetical protein